MPSHDERSWMRPIPGAFGLERSKEAWERRNRPNAQYLTRTGVYASHLYIYVEEEYGYASFLWIYPGTPKELVDDWCNRRTPWGSGLSPSGGSLPGKRFRGEFDPVDFTTMKADREKEWPRRLELVLCPTGETIEGFSHISDFDGNCHIHEEDDSYLKVGYYEVNGVREPEVSFAVLDAIAAL